MKRAEKRGPLVVVAVVDAVLIVLLTLALLRAERGDTDVSDSQDIPQAASSPPGRTKDVAEPDPVTRDVVEPPREDVQAPGAGIPATAVLFGNVVDPDGASVLEARVSVRRGAEPSGERIARLSLRRDRGAAFAVPGLEPGPYRVEVTATGYRAWSVGLEIPRGVDRFRCDVRLERSWELRVRIDTPAGRPVRELLAELKQSEPQLRGVEVDALATVGAPPPLLPPTELRKSPFGIGRWFGAVDFFSGDRPRLPKRYAGLFELPEDRPMHVSAVVRNVVLVTECVEPGQQEVVLVLPIDAVLASLCSVKLRVVDAVSGAPVPDARVDLSDTQSGGMRRPVGEDGRIELRFQRPGRLVLRVHRWDPAASARNYVVELAPGAVVDLGEIPIFELVEVHAVFEGVPEDVEMSVRMTCLDPPPHAALRERALRYGRREGGTFTATVPPGRYRLSANGEGQVGEIEFDTASLSDAPLIVRMQAAGVLRVVPPVDDARVELALVDGSGRVVYRRWITWTTAYDVKLAPGSYVAELTRLDGSQERRPVTVTVAGAELDLR